MLQFISLRKCANIQIKVCFFEVTSCFWGLTGQSVPESTCRSDPTFFVVFFDQEPSVAHRQAMLASHAPTWHHRATGSFSKLVAGTCARDAGPCIGRHSVAVDETIRCVSFCSMVLSHDYGHVLSHDVSHDVVTHDAPCSLSPDGRLHSLKDASTHVFAELHIFPQKNQYL